jgi:hypothetical protein
MAIELKIIYADILNGYSIFNYRQSTNYIKHLTHMESAALDIKYNIYYNKAILDGLPSYKQREEQLINEGSWNAETDKKIDRIRLNIKNLKMSRDKLILDRDKDELQKRIDEINIELLTLLFEKESLIGYTAEKYAAKKNNEYFVFNSLYKDDKFSIKLFSTEQFEELENRDVDEVTSLYNEVIGQFNEFALKKVALYPPFFNLFVLSNENVNDFYGKPILGLTFFQTEVISHCKQFKHILSNAKTQPPQHVLEDPDKLIEWFNSSKAAEKELNKSNEKNQDMGGGSSLVGAKKQDYEKLGVAGSENVINLSKEAAKKGGTLNMQDILKLHGYKV